MLHREEKMKRKWICLFFALSIFTSCVLASQTAQQTQKEIPWGFDEKSVQLQKNGAFRNFVPQGYEIDQALCNDLDLDGIDDVLLVLSTIKEEQTHVDSEMLSTLLLKGKQNSSFEQIKRNDKMIYFNSYDGGGKISSPKEGTFKISISRGTGRGYEYNYFFEYNKEKKDWFFTEYFYNSSGAVSFGESTIITPLNFGEISFDNFDIEKSDYSYIPNEEIEIQEKNIKIHADLQKIILADKEKENRINTLLKNEMRKIIEELKKFKTPIDVRIYSQCVFQSPEILSIEYDISGDTIDTCFTTNIDIVSEKILFLQDIIEPKQLAQIVVNLKLSDNEYDSSYGIPFSQTQKELEQAFLNTNQIEAVFQTNSVCFSIYEQSLCIRWLSDEGLIKRYIAKEELMNHLKFNPWKTKSKAAKHLIWIG